jgi:hypothetical protein
MACINSKLASVMLVVMLASGAVSARLVQRSRLEQIAAQAKGRFEKVPVGDGRVDEITYSQVGGFFNGRAAIVLTQVRMDLAHVVTADWVYSWSQETIDRTVAVGSESESKFLRSMCEGIPRPDSLSAVLAPNVVAIPLIRGETVIDGVTLFMDGEQARINLKADTRYLLFGHFCLPGTFFLSLEDVGFIFPIREDGQLEPALRPGGGEWAKTVMEQKNVDGVAAYLARLRKF